MNVRLSLRAGGMEALALYVASQLKNFFPDSGPTDLQQLIGVLPRTLERMAPILDAVRAFLPGRFDHYNALQYSTFLYLLANESWRRGLDGGAICDRLFYLNKALNGIDLFYSVEMPETFFISHGTGAVLGKVPYGERLVIFQHVTVGRVGDAKPVIGSDVVLYPGVTVSGHSRIGNGSVISAGTVIHNQNIPDNVVVTSVGGQLQVRPRQKNYIDLYYRQEG